MGNSSTKESRPTPRSRSSSLRSPTSPTSADASNNLAHTSSNTSSLLYSTHSRTNRQEAFITGGASVDAAFEPRKETKQEREARKAEKERVARAKERERSLKEESVDGGYLVTLGTYTGPEDFSKPIVRQLMIERRLAPFWRGLNDHSDSWTEHQLVAVARGLSLPAPDEIPHEEHVEHLTGSTQPIAVRSKSSNEPSADHLYFTASRSGFNATSPSSAPTGSSPLFRGRSKTLASLTSKNGSQTDLVPQETKLPHDPYINGQPLEAYLYKDASECPICFLYYPPYLNRTRCCDQPICSECFVQIKRPDPHPPEHLDPTVPAPPEAQRQVEEGLLVSEPAQCPFCVQPEFGVSYDSPSFRRGLAYANQAHGRSISFVKIGSATSSSTSLPSPTGASLPAASQLGRRRATSLSATAPGVVTTDKVRPDWAKKLSDARAQAARRSAAATALHNAAYLMGGLDAAGARLGFGRRRRNMTSSGDDTPVIREGVPIPNMEMLLSALEGHVAAHPRDLSGDGGRVRMGSRGSRTDDLEELMLMEAIRQSLVAEEERKRKEERETAKNAKKEEKAKAKEQKKADKAAKKGGPVLSTSSGNNGTGSFYSTSPSPSPGVGSPTDDAGKGKGKVGSSQETGPSAPWAVDTPISPSQDPQRHLELSRAQLDSEMSEMHAHLQPSTSPSQPQPMQGSRLRHVSDASSSGSSSIESLRNEAVGSDASSFDPSPNLSGNYLPFRGQQSSRSTTAPESDSTATGGRSIPPAAASAAETSSAAADSTADTSTFNYGSLAAMMVNEQSKEGEGHGVENLERAVQSRQHRITETSNSPRMSPDEGQTRSNDARTDRPGDDNARLVQARTVESPARMTRDRDWKQYGDVNVVGKVMEETATQ